MRESVGDFTRFVLRCFEERREADYVARCAIPMMVYSDDGSEITMAATREEAVALLTSTWNNIRAAAARVQGRVVAIGLPQRTGFPVRVDWALYDREGNHVMTSELRYFLCRMADGRLRIELVEVFGPGCACAITAPPASRCA